MTKALMYLADPLHPSCKRILLHQVASAVGLLRLAAVKVQADTVAVMAFEPDAGNRRYGLGRMDAYFFQRRWLPRASNMYPSSGTNISRWFTFRDPLDGKAVEYELELLGSQRLFRNNTVKPWQRK
jgi:hypothetical protein